MIRRVLLVCAFAAAAPSSAEMALLSSGTTLKLEGHRVEDDTVVLLLKGGGEIGVPASAVLGFVRGGLAMATILACSGFAAICGSSLAKIT